MAHLLNKTVKHQIFRNVDVIGVHSAGKAIGLYKNRRIYFDYAIPGEIADVCVAKRQKGYVKGTVNQIIHSSKQRVIPFCKHFGLCGGCNWQHMNYALQLELKHSILQNALDKYAIVTPPVPLPLASPLKICYRNKMEYSFATDDEENLILGFHFAERPDGVIDIQECYLQPHPSRKIYHAAKNIAQQLNFTPYSYTNNTGMLRSLGIRTTLTGQTCVVVGFAHCPADKCRQYLAALRRVLPQITCLYYTILDEPDLHYSDVLYHHFEDTATHITESIDNLEFRISPKAFYQPNPIQAQKVYWQVAEYGNFKGSEFVIDLYTGIGTIACYIASSVGRVIGIEGSADAIADANENARINSIKNAEFITGDILETFNSSFLDRHPKIDVIILDPPRSGTLIEIKKTILAAAPSKIIYVSCNPVSLAFDLKQLCEHHYAVKAIQPFDMFPHTHHIETVVLLEQI